MTAVELFPRDKVIGVFRGFREGGLEFHADLVLPYRAEFHSVPMHGQFLLVQLETPDEAVVGRITSFSAGGKLSSSSGEEFNIRAVRDDRAIPEDLREQYLRYRVDIRILGVLRRDSGARLTFIPSHRRLPHLGSPVAFPSDDVLQEIAGHNADGVCIGHLALGEYVYGGASELLERQPWMQIKGPEVTPRFAVSSLVSRRSFVFARAGFGKSNLTKLLFSELYKQTPTVPKRGGKAAPVGTVIFDREGEYFWPDDVGRPGLCDVPDLDDKLVIFTSRKAPSETYGSFVAGQIKLDIRRLPPKDVIAIAVAPERQDQQNVTKLRSLSQGKWGELVNLIDANGNATPIQDVARILELDQSRQEAEALAARSNMTNVVRMLHDKSSQLMDMLMWSLKRGKLCVIDVSQMSGGQALALSGIILQRIFDRNQEEFTSADPQTIPTIAVIEEAQAVLDERASAARPFVTWVKEGRKYGLGAYMITQQPGSIPTEILSQGDNWFLFHLLSSSDLANVRRANAHFSDDLLSSLLNEPISGQGIYWSSASEMSYPIPVRVLSFETMFKVRDPEYMGTAVKTFVSELKRDFQAPVLVGSVDSEVPAAVSSGDGHQQTFSLGGDEAHVEAIDVMQSYEANVIEVFKANADLISEIREKGAPWVKVQVFLKNALPSTIDDAWQEAYQLLPKAMSEVFGEQDVGWERFRHPNSGKSWLKVREASNDAHR
jgi:uncharacterized protein